MTVRMGIDPGTKTGFAVWDADKNALIALVTARGEVAAEMAVTLAQIHNADEVVIERPAGGVFARPGQNPRQMLRIAKNVGQCQALADEIARALTKATRRWRFTAPMKHGTKWTAEMFAREFFWTKRSSSHSRDAAVIARFGL